MSARWAGVRGWNAVMVSRVRDGVPLIESHRGDGSVRTTEPHRLVNWGRRWYLVAWDVDRDDWRTFRVDRMHLRTPTGPRFTPREPPAGDAPLHVQRGVGAATWRYHGRVLLHASAEHVAARLPLATSVVPADALMLIRQIGPPRAIRVQLS